MNRVKQIEKILHFQPPLSIVKTNGDKRERSRHLTAARKKAACQKSGAARHNLCRLVSSENIQRHNTKNADCIIVRFQEKSKPHPRPKQGCI